MEYRHELSRSPTQRRRIEQGLWGLELHGRLKELGSVRRKAVLASIDDRTKIKAGNQIKVWVGVGNLQADEKRRWEYFSLFFLSV